MDLELIFAFLLVCSLVVSYVLYDRRNDRLEEVKNHLKTKSLRKMGLLSEVWHIMYLKHESPIIHGFEHIPGVDFDQIYHFWTRMAQDYLTFRSIPYKPQYSNDWYWKQLKIEDIDFKQHHIKKITISAKDFENNIDNTDNPLLAVSNFVNSLNMNKMWDPTRPHWTVYYITFKEDNLKQEVYGYARIHHAMGDGVLLSKLLEYHHQVLHKEANPPVANPVPIVDEIKSDDSVTTNSNTPKTDPNASVSSMSQLKTPEPKIMKSRSSRQFSIIKLITLIPWTLYDFLYRFMIFARAPRATPISIGYCQHQHNKDNKLGFAYQCNMAASRPLPLNELKKLSKYYNGTINDFMVALFCQGVNKYMKKILNDEEERDGNGPNGYKSNNKNNNNNNNNSYMDSQPVYWTILKKIYGRDFFIRFVSVFNMRSLIAKDLDKLVNDFANGNFDNDFVMIPLRLPIGDMSFYRRFEAIKDNFNRMKYGPMPLISAFTIKFVYNIAGINAVVFLLEMLSRRCNIMLSNLAGPRVMLPIGINNKTKIFNVFNITNPSNMPITCGVMSYVDKITFTVAADINTMKTPKLLMECIEQEFERLKGKFDNRPADV